MQIPHVLSLLTALSFCSWSCLRIENRAHKTHIFANGMWGVMLGWGGVGVLTFCLVRTVHISTLPRSLECLPRYMLLRCRDLWNACQITCCYAAEISGMLATLYVATLPRSLECLPYRHYWCCVDELQTIHPKNFGCQAQRSHFICQNVAMALRQ